MAKIRIMSTVLLLTIALGTHAQQKEQFRDLLEKYCVEYYDSCFDGKQYVEGSLTITNLEINDADDVIKVSGKHSYKGRYIPFFGRKTYSHADYKAEIRVTASGMDIKFWKWLDFDMTNFWEGPCENTIKFTYK